MFIATFKMIHQWLAEVLAPKTALILCFSLNHIYFCTQINERKKLSYKYKNADELFHLAQHIHPKKSVV